MIDKGFVSFSGLLIILFSNMGDSYMGEFALLKKNELKLVIFQSVYYTSKHYVKIKIKKICCCSVTKLCLTL